MRNVTNATSRPRSRKRTPAATTPAPSLASVTGRNVGPFESIVSLGLGTLFLVGALFPRSFKQLLLIGLGGGLVYRGMTSHCGLYEALGLDSEKGSVLDQINKKYLSGSLGNRS